MSGRRESSSGEVRNMNGRTDDEENGACYRRVWHSTVQHTPGSSERVRVVARRVGARIAGYQHSMAIACSTIALTKHIHTHMYLYLLITGYKDSPQKH